MLLLKHKIVKPAWRLPIYMKYSVSSKRNNRITLPYYDEDSQIVRAKGNIKFSYGGPSQRQASGTNPWIKALRQGRR